jgi:hypothetical protein
MPRASKRAAGKRASRPARASSADLVRAVRKPPAPPARVEPDARKYDRRAARRQIEEETERSR